MYTRPVNNTTLQMACSLEGVIHETSIAAHVAESAGTIDQLLLGQADQLAGFLGMLPY